MKLGSGEVEQQPLMSTIVGSNPIHDGHASGGDGSPMRKKTHHYSRIKTIDDVLSDLPIPGRFYNYMLIVCGIAYATDAMEVNIIGYISSCASHEWHVSQSAMASLSAAVFCGELLGAPFFSHLSDIHGRKPAMIWSMILISFFSWISAFAWNVYSLYIFRFIVGFGIGGACIPFDLLAEFLPPSGGRGLYLALAQLSWGIGTPLVAGVSWILAVLNNNQLQWRVLTCIVAIPITIATIIAHIMILESPRFLLHNSRIEEAKEILHSAAKINGSVIADFTFKIEEKYISNNDIEDKNLLTDTQQQHQHHQQELEQGSFNFFSWHFFEEWKEKIYELFSPELRLQTMQMLLIFFLGGGCYYGIILLQNAVYDTTSTSSKEKLCSFDFYSQFLSSTSEFAGGLFSLFAIHYTSRPTGLALAFLIASIAMLTFSFHLNETVDLCCFWFARFGMIIQGTYSWASCVENYDTKHRATAFALSYAFSRISSLLTAYLVPAVTNEHMGFILGCCLFLGTITSVRVQDTKDKPIDVDGM